MAPLWLPDSDMAARNMESVRNKHPHSKSTLLPWSKWITIVLEQTSALENDQDGVRGKHLSPPPAHCQLLMMGQSTPLSYLTRGYPPHTPLPPLIFIFGFSSPRSRCSSIVPLTLERDKWYPLPLLLTRQRLASGHLQFGTPLSGTTVSPWVETGWLCWEASLAQMPAAAMPRKNMSATCWLQAAPQLCLRLWV